MPNPQYQPNDPRYYSQPSAFPTINKLFGGAEPLDPIETEAVHQSPENRAAYYELLLPSVADNEQAVLDSIKDKFPKFSTAGLNRNARLELSRQARADIKEASLEYLNIDKSRLNTAGADRTYYVLLQPGASEEIKAQNRQIEETVLNGTPEDRGRLFEQRILEAGEWFRRSQQGVPDNELVGQMASLHMSHNVVVNAENIRALVASGDIILSKETQQILAEMEGGSTGMDMLKNQMKLIANPTYAFVDYTKFQGADPRTLFDIAFDMEDSMPAAGDYIKIVQIMEEERKSAMRENLSANIRKDFDMQAEEKPLIQLINCNSDQFKQEYTEDFRNTDLTDAIHPTNVLVTTSNGNVACYRVKPSAQVERISAADMRGDYAKETNKNLNTLKIGLEIANKGFFIGSKAYRDVGKAMKELFEYNRSMSNPPTPEQLEQMQQILGNLVGLCEAYLNTKDPENFKNQREELRYNAVDSIKSFCQKNELQYNLQKQATELEKQGVLAFSAAVPGSVDGSQFFPNHGQTELRTKVHETYAEGHVDNSDDANYQSAKLVDTRIPSSDAGDIADSLRNSIKLSLEQVMLDKNGYDPEDARNIMSNMVVLEMVKAGRQIGADGRILAGPVEQALAKDPGAVIQSVRDNRIFQNLTGNMSREMLAHFVMTDGARNMAEILSNKAVKQEKSEGDKIEQAFLKLEKLSEKEIEEQTRSKSMYLQNNP